MIIFPYLTTDEPHHILEGGCLFISLSQDYSKKDGGEESIFKLCSYVLLQNQMLFSRDNTV